MKYEALKLWIARNHLREGYVPSPEQFEKNYLQCCGFPMDFEFLDNDNVTEYYSCSICGEIKKKLEVQDK